MQGKCGIIGMGQAEGLAGWRVRVEARIRLGACPEGPRNPCMRGDVK